MAFIYSVLVHWSGWVVHCVVDSTWALMVATALVFVEWEHGGSMHDALKRSRIGAIVMVHGQHRSDMVILTTRQTDLEMVMAFGSTPLLKLAVVWDAISLDQGAFCSQQLYRTPPLPLERVPSILLVICEASCAE
jgi:hypothetical protein